MNERRVLLVRLKADFNIRQKTNNNDVIIDAKATRAHIRKKVREGEQKRRNGRIEKSRRKGGSDVDLRENTAKAFDCGISSVKLMAATSTTLSYGNVHEFEGGRGREADAGRRSQRERACFHTYIRITYANLRRETRTR